MKAYKGFNKDMTCRGFQYEEGKEYTHEGEIKICNKGFHACEDPLDCLEYYTPNKSVYHEVELEDVSPERGDDDTKIVGKTIRIGAKLSISDMVKASIDFRMSKCTSVPGGRSTQDCGAANATGDGGAVNATGDGGAANATGYRGAANATGYGGAANATGDYGAASATGKAGVALAAGLRCKAKGTIGCALCLIERKWNNEQKIHEIINCKAVIVDGKEIKADTWYMLVNGEITEVK